MAKFKDLHLLLQEDHRILFGDDSLGVYGPAEYPATNLGSEKPFIAYTTISGYNDTLPGMGINNIAETDQLVVSVPLAGERGTQPYHMVRFDQLQDAIFDEVNSDWQDSVLTFSGTPPGSPNDGDRYIVEATATGDWTGLEDYIVEWSTASGIWETYAPNEGFTTFVEDEDKYYLYYNGAWAPMGEGIDHGDLIGLGDDDHTYYVPTDGSRGFTSTVSGVYPVEDYHLVTKDYVDATVTGSIGIISHSDLINLGADDHTQYTLTTGARGFTGTVSGIDPTESYHLTTRWYVDDQISTLSGSIVLDHGSLSGLEDDDHTQYVPTDGSRGFTNTVSGVYPVSDYDLTTKEYVDDQFSTLSGTRKWGRIACIDGNRDQAVTFDNAYPDDDYTVVASLTNEVDAKPSIYSTIQGVKTAAGFTTHFSGKIDSANFILEWFAFYGQQH